MAIALFLALLVFVSGIEPGTEDEVRPSFYIICVATSHYQYTQNACTVVAALLHYFFTTVFTWMLCEGLMLYFLLVKVFNTGVGERKLFYFCLGWGE